MPGATSCESGIKFFHVFKMSSGSSGGHGGVRRGAGRKPGSRSRLTVEIKATLTETARQYTREALHTLIEIMGDARHSPTARARCAEAVLDRGWGKALQPISGPAGGPIETRVSEVELARRIAFALELGARSTPTLASGKEQEPEGE
jgi:hypothetical protein